MTRLAEDLAALKAELTNDPENLGLTLEAAEDAANADKLNAVSPTRLVKRQWITTPEILNEIDPDEHQGLSNQQHRYLRDVLSLGQLNPFKQSKLICGLCNMFASGSISLSALEAVMVEPGSRITKMYQDGLLSDDTPVTPSDVADAHQLPAQRIGYRLP